MVKTTPVPERRGTSQRQAWNPRAPSGKYAFGTASTSTTTAEMPAVTGPAPSAGIQPEVRGAATGPGASRTLPPYDDLGESTDANDIGRLTDYGDPPLVPEARDRAVLLRMDGVAAGEVASVGDSPVTIGRDPSNVIDIQDGGISRHHARVARVHGRHVAEDLGSRNGTYVQGRKITQVVLEDGDWIQLGPRVSFRYSITDARQERLLRQLYESSTRDALTGAYNRQHFEERLRAEIAYAARHATVLSLVLFDLDHFKLTNDTYGHLAGDAVLRAVAATVNASLRAEDVFARYGGEEFAVVLRSVDRVGAERVGERLRTSVEGTVVNHRGFALRVTISAGVAALSECARQTATDLVGLADRRLYVAKDGGRNRVVSGD